MPIIHPKAPEGGVELISRHVGKILQDHAPFEALMKSAKAEDLSLAEPHQIYVVDLDAIAAGKLLSAATLVGWRYLIVQGNDAVSEAEHSEPEAEGAAEFLGLYKSRFANETLNAIHAVEGSPKLAKQDYELRYLKVPALYLAAIWLAREGKDLIVPLDPAPDGLKANVPISEEAVLKALRPLAGKTVKFEKSFKARRKRVLGAGK